MAPECVCVSDPLWLDVLWSLLGLLLGMIFGYILRGRQDKK